MFKKLTSCFQSDEINTGRQVELDIAKGFAIVFMVLCHVFMYFTDWSSPLLSKLLYDILGGPFAAPVFMFCMGVGIQYSRNNQPKHLFHRGCQLLLLAFGLDFVRYVIPLYLYDALTGSPSLLKTLTDSFGVDILQFSGLFFLVFSFVKRSKYRPAGYVVIAVLFSLAGQLLNGFSIPNTAANLAASFFWRSSSASYFPLLNWFIFPTVGYHFGFLLKRCSDKNTFYRTIFPIPFLLSFLYLSCLVFHGISDDLYYGMGPIQAFFALNLTLSIFVVCFLFVAKIPVLVKVFSWMSKQITSIYCVHWVLIMDLYTILILTSPVDTFPNWVLVPLGFCVLVISCLIVAVFRRHKKKRP